MEALWEDFKAAIMHGASDNQPHGSVPLYGRSSIRLCWWRLKLRCWRGEAEDVRELLQRPDFKNMISSQFDRRLQYIALTRRESRLTRLAGSSGGGSTGDEEDRRWMGLAWPVGEAIRKDTEHLRTEKFYDGEDGGYLHSVRQALLP